MGAAGLKQLLPQAEALLAAKYLQVDVKVIVERAPLRRVPAKTDDKVLPPPSWEKAFLPVDRVLVMVVVKKAVGIRTPPTCGLLRGELPTPRSDGMELLRLEFVLPPAARQSMAEKLLWGGCAEGVADDAAALAARAADAATSGGAAWKRGGALGGSLSPLSG